jgi:uncharacterized protein
LTALLDANVLIALLDKRHIAHAAAERWFGQNAVHGWATCPITENAVVRILGKPSYPEGPGDVELVADMLRRWTEHPQHAFWPDDLSLLNAGLFVRPFATGTKHLTDIYLLALAVSRGATLVTLDQRLRTDAVAGGAEAVFLIPTDYASSSMSQ